MQNTLQGELVSRVRAAIGGIVNFRTALIVQRLPKTRSGKILRAILRKLVDGQPFDMPSTIDDPAIIDEVRAVLDGWRAR